MDILNTQNGYFGPFLTNFETEVHHVRHPFPAGTAEFLAHT